MTKSVVLHGENQPLLRNKFLEYISQAREKGMEVIQIDWKKSDDKELKLSSRSQGLLSKFTLVVIEGFFTNNKKALDIIKDLPKDEVFYLFLENKKLALATVRWLQKFFIVQEFPVPASIFNFLNSLTPQNAKLSLNFFILSRQKDSDEFINIMLERHIRLLIWAKEDAASLKLPEWQKNKLVSQASKFSTIQLRYLHTKLVELDRYNKKSQLPESLGESLEVLLATL